MVNNKEKRECCGCGVCAAVCPKNAIKMIEDEYGFMYPHLDEVACIRCNRCDKACSFNKNVDINRPRKVYSARNISDTVCKLSTSGGMFTAISDYYLEHDGIVYATAFDDEMNLSHIRMDNKNLRDSARGSKYVQSDISSIYKDILTDVKNKEVVFFGTPCQVSAVKMIIPVQCKKNILFVDVICNGVSSPLIWKEHVKRIEDKYKKKVCNYNFRPKTKGYQTQTEIAFFADNTKKEFSYAFDRYNCLYYSGLIMRPSCTNCGYCSECRVSDITIADCSALKQEEVSFDIFYGVSTLIINTKFGEEVFDKISNKVLVEEKTIENLEQIRLHRCGEANPNSSRFIKNCSIYGIKGAIKRQYSIFDRIKFRIVDFLYRVKGKC